MFGYRHVGRFIDIGTPESYTAAAASVFAIAGATLGARTRQQHNGKRGS
jgi:NDP-sugar pyrophosphorylase family protein